MSKIKIFALGGLNENGKNMYIVDVDENIFVFDAGLKYGDDKLFGIDYIIPNYNYLKKNKEKIKGIFITHPHFENMGAISNILNELKNVKIYGTKFTIDTIKTCLEEHKITTNNLVEISPHKKINFGKNSVFPIMLTHSVPENVGYVLNTEDKSIFYTGNFVFDSTMRNYYKTDVGKLAYLGKQGVLCLLSESLYAEKNGYTSPKNRIYNLINEILNKTEDRIIFNISSTNIYRIQEVFNELSKTHRRVVIMGKRLQKIINYVIDNKYVVFDKKNIGDLSNINDKDSIIITSSENEKPFVNIEKIISGYDKYITFKPSDTVVFLEPVTEDVEKIIVKVSDKISKIGAEVITLSNKKYLTHHASSEDLMLMLDLINPKYYFPVIGEYRYQVANAKIAEKIGLKKENILLKQNGEVIYFEDGKLKEHKEKIETDSIMIDGTSTEDVGELVLKDREMLSDNGIVIICATLNKQTKEILSGPEVLTRGFVYVKENIKLINEIKTLSLKLIVENTHKNYVEYNKIKNSIREEVGKYLYYETECNPMILTVIQEI